MVMIYDGTFNGFLTVVFQAFEDKLPVADIQRKGRVQKELFAKTLYVDTDIQKAKQVWYTLRSKAYEPLKNIYFAFLSETTGIEQHLYTKIHRLLNGITAKAAPARDANLEKIEELAVQVSREKRKWERELNLNFPKGKPHVAYIKPEFNILPLISKYFRTAYPSGNWIIFDQVRNYGLLFNGATVRFVKDIPEHFLMAEAA